MFRFFCITLLCIIGLWIIREKSISRYMIRKNRKKIIKNKRILTYNIQRLPYSTKPLNVLKTLIRDHSIVLLQECFCNIFYDDIEYHFPEYNIIKGSMNGYRLINSGLVLLSKYPILNYYFRSFSSQRYLSADVLAEKGFIIALIQFGIHKIYIINTHLQSSIYRNDDEVALLQWKELYEHLNTLEYPWIIGGDFNLNYSKILNHINPYYIYSTLTPSIYIQYDENHKELDTSCIYKEGYDGFGFDYFITHRISLESPITIPFTYSDHAPVMSTIIKK